MRNTIKCYPSDLPPLMCQGIHTHAHTHTCCVSIIISFFILITTHPNWYFVKKRWAHSLVNVWANKVVVMIIWVQVCSAWSLSKPRTAEMRPHTKAHTYLKHKNGLLFFFFLFGNPTAWLLRMDLRWQYPVTMSKGWLCLNLGEIGQWLVVSP